MDVRLHSVSFSKKLVVILLGLGIAAAACFSVYRSTVRESSNKIVAYCGSASKPALEAATENFEEEAGLRVELHFGGSGTMLSQMEMSQKGDLYIPGSPDYMVRAIGDNVVFPETAEVIAYLVPAIITLRGNPESVASLEDLGRRGVEVGIGDPKSVCVGEYAVGILRNSGLLGEVENNIVVHAESCSQTASLAVIGKVDAIIGWRVFHLWHPEKTEVVYIKSDRMPRIAFVPVAISKYTDDRRRAQRFMDYLTGPAGNQSFRDHGYIATENEARNFAPNAEILELRGQNGI